MALRIYNTKTRKKEAFTPIAKGKVGMYVCGPTVYDSAHLGHGRSAVAFDLVRRYLIFSGYDVRFVFNYTDIDDKMIARAKKERISVPKLAERIIPEYERDYLTLRVMPPTVAPKATDHVDEIISIIRMLEKKKATYAIDDGVYFDISSHPAYGSLSGQDLDALEAGARVEVDRQKKNPADFVLWKFKKEGEPSWPSPWGEGRPGWHIECSAMTHRYLGKEFDIHGGGADLIFPHHEDELAQSEKALGTSVVQYWMHNGFVTVNSEKMSKSLGNFFLLKDILKRYDAAVVRYFLISTHYRGPLNFADTLLDSAKSSLERIQECVDKLRERQDEKTASSLSPAKDDASLKKHLSDAKKRFIKAMDDDFDTSSAFAAIFDLVRKLNSCIAAHKISPAGAASALGLFSELDSVLCVMALKDPVDSGVAQEILALAAARDAARKKKDWKESDRLRDAIIGQGYRVDDTPTGTNVKKI